MRTICILLGLCLAPGDSPVAQEPAPAPRGAVSDEATRSNGGGDVKRPPWLSWSDLNKLPLHCEVIASERWATPEEARLDVLEKSAVRAANFVAESGDASKRSWQVPTWLVNDHLLREPIYVEELDWTYGPMFRAHAFIELSPDTRKVLLEKWREVVVRQRLGQVGGTLGFIFVCLVTLVTYLRLDDATRGYYSRWLGLAATTVVAGSAAVLYTWIA